jgi:hypothetical protein
VIFLSAYQVSDRTDVMAAAYGVRYVLRVPIEPDVIYMAVNAVLAKKKSGQLPP